MPSSTVTLLLPARSRFGGQRLSESAGRWFGRADRTQVGGDLVERQFQILPRGWPVAAVTRQRDAGDAQGSAWLRADPVYIQPDINGARLLSHGEALSLSVADSAAFLPALKPLCGDIGFPIDAPHPSRWYLQLPPGAKLPAMASLDQALGADLFDQLPEGPEGRRWRALLSEAQVVLHNHPRNAERAALGLAPVNSLWFWGAGRVPDAVSTPHTSLFSDDDTLVAFAAAAGAHSGPLPPRWQPGEGGQLFDLRHLRDLTVFDRDWWLPVLAYLQTGRLVRATICFADGHQLTLVPKQRWRFWRRALHSFVSPNAGASE
ncbi:MAG: phosphoglycerate mutase [Lysobacter sp.]